MLRVLVNVGATAMVAWLVIAFSYGATLVTVRAVIGFFKKSQPGTADLHGDELTMLEREALDSTVRWAYTRGYVDALDGCKLTDEATAFIVQEFRLKWGEDRRETVG